MRKNSAAEPWTAETIWSKTQELVRRLRSWHLEDVQNPAQFATVDDVRDWTRRTFGDVIRNVTAAGRPERSLQLYRFNGSAPPGKAEIGGQPCAGEAYENPDRDTDHSLTRFLLTDYKLHLDASPPLPGSDSLKQALEQLLALRAYAVRGPQGDEPWPEMYLPDWNGQLRGWLVVGCRVPDAPLDALKDAAQIVFVRAATPASIPQPATDPDRYLDLQQIAAFANISKRSIERYKNHDEHRMPDPDREGGGGRKAEWKWSTIKPWIEKTFGRNLSNVDPGAIFRK